MLEIFLFCRTIIALLQVWTFSLYVYMHVSCIVPYKENCSCSQNNATSEQSIWINSKTFCKQTGFLGISSTIVLINLVVTFEMLTILYLTSLLSDTICCVLTGIGKFIQGISTSSVKLILWSVFLRGSFPIIVFFFWSGSLHVSLLCLKHRSWRRAVDHTCEWKDHSVLRHSVCLLECCTWTQALTCKARKRSCF